MSSVGLKDGQTGSGSTSYGFLFFTLGLHSSLCFPSFYAQGGILAGEGLGGVGQAVVNTPHLLMQFPHADSLISFTFRVRHCRRLPWHR